VKTVTRCYSQAAEAIVEGNYTPENIAAWKESLSTVFNRGFWDGYYLGRHLGEWSETYGNKATKRKTYIGKVTNFFANISVAEILIESGELSVNDEVLIIGATTGVMELTLKEIRVELKPVKKSVKGEYCSIAINNRVRRGDKLYKWENAINVRM
jgi:putative protease